MPAGRPPKPTERKRRNGNPGKHPLPAAKVTLVVTEEEGPPPVPENFGDVASEAWLRLWDAAGQWLSPKTDLNLMTRLCEAYEDRAEVREEIETAGWFTFKPNANGTGQELVVHPAANILDKLDTKILQMESRAGFTPTDRVRLGVEVVKGQTATSKLEAQRARLEAHRQGRSA